MLELQPGIEWSIDDREELVAVTMGGEVVHRVEPGTHPKLAKRQYYVALKQFDRRKSRVDRRQFVRESSPDRRISA